LGQRIVSAIDSCPYGAYTLSNAAEALENWHWSQFRNEEEGRKEMGGEYISKKDMAKHAPRWAWDWKLRKDAFVLSGDPCLNKALDLLERRREDFVALRGKELRWHRPQGYIPGLAVHWRGMEDESGTSIVERMGDMEFEDRAQSYGQQLAAIVFPLEKREWMPKAFEAAAAYVKCGSALLSLLNLLKTMPADAVPKRRRKKAKTLAQIFTEEEAR
jgi:hypothetical protein